MLELDQPLLLRSGLDWVEADDEILLLDLKRGGLFALDEVASRLWSALSRGLTVREAMQNLIEEFDVDEQTLQSDTIAFLQSLIDRGLLSKKCQP